MGLGNPGAKYAETRHNAGFWFLDLLAKRSGAVLRPQSKFHAELAKTGVYGQDCILVKPRTFMNHSGQAVSAVVEYYKIPSDRLLIVSERSMETNSGRSLGRAEISTSVIKCWITTPEVLPAGDSSSPIKWTGTSILRICSADTRKKSICIMTGL